MKPTPDPDDDTEKPEAALRAEITALRDGLDAITYGFILFNADDRVVAFNASRSDLFPSFADILDVGVNYRDLLRSQLEQGQIDSATGREEEWIEDRTKNHQIADGTPTEQVFADGRVIRLREHRTSSGGIVSVRTDITELKNAQRRLEDSEQTFRTLLETAPIPLVLAAEGKYLYANQKTHNLLGVEMGELVGRKTRDFYADPLVYAEAISLLTKDERIERFEIELQRHDGDRIWVIVSSAPINFEGQPAIFAGMLDITAHKQTEQELLESERRFRAIAESSPIPMLITRQNDGLILYANEHVEALLGYEEEGILGRKVEIFYEDPSAREGRAAAAREKDYLDRAVMEMRRSDGSLVSTIHSLRAIKFDGVPAIVDAFMDITEQQKNELELRQARDRAEDANASKTQFLAVMSHELRAPLNAIIGFLDIMQQEMFGPMGHERYSSYATDIFPKRQAPIGAAVGYSGSFPDRGGPP